MSDVVATAELPKEVKDDPVLHCQCIAGASPIAELEAMLDQAGFVDIRIQPKDESRDFIREWSPDLPAERFITSATIEALKPA